MTRFTLTVPLQDNNGAFRQDYVRVAEQVIGERFDGWTRHHAIGEWKGQQDGETYTVREPVAVYTIDAENHQDTDAAWLIGVAQSLAVYCEQDAVYLTAQPVTTYLVGPAKVPEWQG